MSINSNSQSGNLSNNNVLLNEKVFARGPAGNGIEKTEKTNTQGLVDTYTITYTNGKTTTYQVRNGANGADGQNGQNGADGLNGADGQDGINGIDGQDGKSLEYNWQGTNLGVRQEGQAEYTYSDLKGPQGSQGTPRSKWG